MLLKLKDGGVEKIWSDNDYYSGCPTCDYGSQYINEFEVTLTKYNVKVKVSQMYEYRFSTGDLMEIFLPNISEISNMTENEFVEWFKEIIVAPKKESNGGFFDYDNLYSFEYSFDVSDNINSDEE